jgi:hypothetical protein
MSVEEKDVHGTLVSVVGLVSSRVKHEALFKSFIKPRHTYLPTLHASMASKKSHFQPSVKGA